MASLVAVSMGALIVSATVAEVKPDVFDVAVTERDYQARRRRYAAKCGVGAALKIRIEPEEEAYTYAQLKHYWGFVVTPFSEETGYHKEEAHRLLKLECLPEGKTSLTELTRDELTAYSQAAEQTAREWCPEAFILYDAVR